MANSVQSPNSDQRNPTQRFCFNFLSGSYVLNLNFAYTFLLCVYGEKTKFVLILFLLVRNSVSSDKWACICHWFSDMLREGLLERWEQGVRLSNQLLLSCLRPTLWIYWRSVCHQKLSCRLISICRCLGSRSNPWSFLICLKLGPITVAAISLLLTGGIRRVSDSNPVSCRSRERESGGGAENPSSCLQSVCLAATLTLVCRYLDLVDTIGHMVS